MPIKIYWNDDPKTILIVDLTSGDWDWSQYDAAIDETTKITKSMEHQILVILLSAPALPAGNPIPHAQRALRMQPDTVRLYILVGGNYFTRTMNNLLMKLFPKIRIVFAGTKEEAFKIAAAEGFVVAKPLP